MQASLASQAPGLHMRTCSCLSRREKRGGAKPLEVAALYYWKDGFMFLACPDPQYPGEVETEHSHKGSDREIVFSFIAK